MRAKICGLTTPEAIEAAAEAGAAYIGFVFFPKSPRNISLAEAEVLALSVPPGIVKVALTVNADDALIDDIAALPIDMFQLHGSESPTRVAEVKARTGLPVMKAIGVADASDLERIADYEGVADQILVDAKPPKGGEVPGGNGLAFDWRLIEGRDWARPWMLAGGLDPSNVSAAVRLTGAAQIDVSSGVESTPGIKDIERIRAFMKAALDTGG
ncbi:MAG: phosphoribosylanthranilate isomerase [Paracoccaceae bacterium]|jgi:phosphoribosylanthranilate isomerase|nr:phosphoribosylanthranilate isomerase [Paracoccaceae bacterium]MDG1373479.1 phosphoribosylanthranilate isomerase [Paracoccaceae bacterium]